MIGNFVRVAIRNFYKRKFFFLINLLGLSLGFASYICLYLFTASEQQYDQFHANIDRLYRVKASRFHKNVLSRELVDVCLAVGPDMKESFPEVERYVQLTKLTSLVRYQYDWYKTERSCYASEDFFKVFSFPLIKGNDSLALSRPFTAVISHSYAKTIFKDEDPIGKTINLKGRWDYEITGVFSDMPPNSHINFDIIFSFESYKRNLNKFVLEEPWRWDGFVTYILLAPKVNTVSFEEKIPLLVEEKTGEWLRNTEQHLELSLQPISSIHLNSNFQGEFQKNGDGKLVLYLELIALSIILLAWINYISLSSAKSLERAREVGVRKTLGSHRSLLIIQFLTESLVLNVTAIILSLLLIVSVSKYWPQLDSVIKNLYMISGAQWLVLCCVLLGGSIISGLYPAFVLSHFNPTVVLKGSTLGSAQGIGIRKVLIILQYVCSLVLVIWIYTAGKQIQYLRSQPLGFDDQYQLVIRDSEVYDSLYVRRVENFKSEVVRLPHVNDMSYTEVLPGEMIRAYANGVRRIKADTSDVNSFSYVRVDDRFAQVLGLELIAGRFFIETSMKRKEVAVNLSATKLLGFINPDDAIQQEIYFRDDTVRIVGVLQDFYFHSPRENLKPLIFQYDPNGGFYFVLKIQNQNAVQVIEEVGKLYAEIFPGQPFQYQFLDEHFERQYQNDRTFEQALLFFSGLSVWITCLGLIGMAAYSATTRKKEISIRKVLGSSSFQVLWMFWFDYIKLIVLSAGVAIPIAWYVTSHWLSGFHLRIDLSPSLFLVPLALLIITTLFAVSVQTIRSAWTNPIDGLRHE